MRFKPGPRRDSARQHALKALAKSDKGLEYLEFRRVLSKLYSNKATVAVALAKMKSEGLVQVTVTLTAEGQKRLENDLHSIFDLTN